MNVQDMIERLSQLPPKLPVRGFVNYEPADITQILLDQFASEVFIYMEEDPR